MAADRAPSGLGLALGHPLNILLLGAAGASAALTGSWIPLAVGAATELVWLAVGRQLGGFADYVEHRQRAALAAGQSHGEQAELSKVSEADRRRFLALDQIRHDIHRLVKDSDALEQSMLEPELAKVDRLVGSFLGLARRAATYEAFVQESDLNALEEEARRQEKLVSLAKDAEDRSVAAQNLDLMQARLQHAAEVRRLLKRARGQLNLVENTLELMRDQVASLQSPAELSAQLDDLVRSVDAIEASAKETRAIEAQARAIGTRT